ncbi:hypothetical protein T484DRAFT_1775522 [Baffinella frigidus]|nr:hypothetical protein T484DRAFT_1775522 [Cryptophyta sp. CCMP2293]
MPSAPAPCRIALFLAGCAILAAPQQSLGALLPIFSSQQGVWMKAPRSAFERGSSISQTYLRRPALLRCRGGNEDDPVRPGEFVIGEKGEEDDGFEEEFEGREYEEIKVKPRVNPAKPPDERPARMWDCLVTSDWTAASEINAHSHPHALEGS